MTLAIVPFTADHFDAAAALLAARHRADRAWAPDLSARYEDCTAAASELRDLLAEEGMAGVAALRNGGLVGFLLGKRELSHPTSAWAGMMRPRSAEIPYAGWAAEPEQAAMVYPQLYAALAERWVAGGVTAHYVTVPLNRETADVWLDLGFGRFIEMGVRDTEPVAWSKAGGSIDIEVRRAGPDDEEAVQTLLTEMLRAWSDPPTFVPFLPETEAARRQFTAVLLADPACPHWLALVDGRVMGMQVFTEPASAHWNVSKLQSPEDAVYLFLASTMPGARGTGVGSALLAQTMAWARGTGYERCAAHFVTSTLAAVFWRARGFSPVSHWLCHVVDERAVWADGRT